MACCGQGRAALSMNGQVAATQRGAASMPSPVVVYQYTGSSGMTVVGSATGRTYRFAGLGSRVQVDALDARSLAAVPNLIRVQGA